MESTQVSFAVLGQIRVRVGGSEVVITSRRVLNLLAGLLARANRPVSVDQLAEWVWDGRMPKSPKAAIQTYVLRLRQVIGRDVLRTTVDGYVIEADDTTLDLSRFVTFAERARRAEHAGDLATAATLLGEALGLWQGDAFGGVTSDALLRDEGAQLAEQRLAARRRWAELQSRLGEHELVVAELRTLTSEHPLREELRELLILALYRAGRRADALDEYTRTKELLAAELGLDPSPQLQRLQRAILAADSAPDAVAAPPHVVPSELPADVRRFTGRIAELRALDRALAVDQSAVGIALVVGTAGVGKTALAVHWGHQTRRRYPGGRLYVNLHGFGKAAPMRPIDALATMLAALGMPAARVPIDVERASRMFRSLLADRSVLVVLDNAADAAQVRPLLPAGAGCSVIVTSRNRLDGLVVSHGAARVRVDPLSRDDAVSLLRQSVPDGSDEALAELAARCADLPLALRVAAANASADPHRSLRQYVCEFGKGDRLHGLQVHDDLSSAVRTAFEHSYTRLTPAPQRLFRLIGLVPGRDFSPGAAAALAGLSHDEATATLRTLAATHLVDQLAADRFGFHDLMRDYATHLVTSTDAADARGAASDRLLDWYLYGARAAAERLDPVFVRPDLPPRPDDVPPVEHSDRIGALAWLDAERPNLVEAVEHAAAHRPDRAWRLGVTLRPYFAWASALVEWSAVADAAVRAADTDGDALGQAAAAANRAHLYQRLGDNLKVVAEGERALHLARHAEWADVEGPVMTSIGLANQDLGQLTSAAMYHRRVLAAAPRAGSPQGVAVALHNLGTVYELMGRLGESVGCSERAYWLCSNSGDRVGQALALFNIGTAQHQLGETAAAVRNLSDAIDLAGDIGHRTSEMLARMAMSRVCRDGGDLEPATRHADASVAIAHEIGDRPRQVRTLNARASIDLVTGRVEDAAGRYRQALKVAVAAGIAQAQVETLVGLACVERRHGNLRHALDLGLAALRMAEVVGCAGHGIRARIAIAETCLDVFRADRRATDALDQALTHARAAISACDRTGHRIERACALKVYWAAAERDVARHLPGERPALLKAAR